MQRVRQLFPILLIAAIGGVASAEDVPLPRPRPAPDFVPFAESARPFFDPAELTTELSDCRKRLNEIAVVEPLPRLIGPGECGGRDRECRNVDGESAGGVDLMVRRGTLL